VRKVKIKEINEYVGTSINPADTPDRLFELYSVPSFESGEPEIINGSDIGSTKITVEDGDVLICKINPRINRVWVVNHRTEHQLIASSEWIVVRNSKIAPDYLRWYFSSPAFRTLITSQVAGIGGSLTRAQPKQVAQYSVPLPEIYEQRRIADTLSHVDRLIKQHQQQLAKLDELVKSRFVELFGDGQYPKVALIDLIKEGAGLSYGIVQPGDDGTGDMGVLRPVDIVDGKIFTASIKYIDRSIGDGFRKTELTGDELLITVRGTTGITALTDNRFIGMNVTRGIAVVRYDRSIINPVYLNAYLNTDESQRYIKEHTRGATLQQINLSDLRVQEIIVPPIELQEQMAAFVEQTDKSKLVIQQSLEKLETLKKALMQEYFG